ETVAGFRNAVKDTRGRSTQELRTRAITLTSALDAGFPGAGLAEPGSRVAEEDPGAAHVLIPRDRFGLGDGFAEGQPRTQPLEELAVHVHLLSRLTQRRGGPHRERAALRGPLQRLGQTLRPDVVEEPVQTGHGCHTR